MPPQLINDFLGGFAHYIFSVFSLVRRSWAETMWFAESFRYDKEREETIDFIRNACIQQLNGELGDKAESHLRRFLLRLPANVGPAPMVRISTSIRPSRNVSGGEEETSAGKIVFSIDVAPFKANGWGWHNSEPVKLLFDRVGAPFMALSVPFLIRYAARRYTGISKLEIENHYGEDAFVGISLQDTLKPFADAGHWKASLKEITVDNFDLSLDDDSIEFETYPESLEVVKIMFPMAASKRNMHSTLFKMMARSRCLKEADAFGHCGVLSPLAVQCFCDLMLKTTKFCDGSRYEPRIWSNFHHTIVPWFQLYLYVSTRNTDAMQKTLSAGCIHDDSGMALPHGWSSSNADQVLAVVYHFSVLARF
jgi:hypothetical protein